LHQLFISEKKDLQAASCKSFFFMPLNELLCSARFENYSFLSSGAIAGVFIGFPSSALNREP
jgi:hypothetical protein